MAETPIRLASAAGAIVGEAPLWSGPGLSTLFVTTISFGIDDAALPAQPWAGRLLALDPGIAGTPEHAFGGEA
jgi:sugar lactone lactonase YvrE